MQTLTPCSGCQWCGEETARDDCASAIECDLQQMEVSLSLKGSQVDTELTLSLFILVFVLFSVLAT